MYNEKLNLQAGDELIVNRDNKTMEIIKKQKPLPAMNIHPGEVLKEAMENQNIESLDYANLTDIEAEYASLFLWGKSEISGFLDNKLCNWLDLPYGYFLELQAKYLKTEQVKKEREGEKIKEFYSFLIVQMLTVQMMCCNQATDGGVFLFETLEVVRNKFEELFPEVKE